MLHVAFGTLKGRKLKTPPTHLARTTTHFMRLQLMNILYNKYGIKDAYVADICAGCGSVGIEFLSAGAKHTTFVEYAHSVLPILRYNIQSLQISEFCTVLVRNAIKLPTSPYFYTYIFLDPPYGKKLISSIITQLIQKKWMGEKTILIVQQDKGEEILQHYPTKIICIDERILGQTLIRFYELST